MINFRQPLFILSLITIFSIGVSFAFSFSTVRAQMTTELSTPRVASYGIFAVESSGINGNLSLSENFAAGESTKIVVTLIGISKDSTYPVALFKGNCRPERKLVLALNAVGADSDPYASISYSEVPMNHGPMVIILCMSMIYPRVKF